MNTEIFAVASDIDGTVLRHAIGKERRDPPPTPRVEGAMIRLRREGIPAIAETSRSQGLMEGEAVRRLHFGLSVIDGGATIYDAASAKVRERNWLTPQRLRPVVRDIGALCTDIYCDPDGIARTGDNLQLDNLRESPSIFAIFESRHTSEIAERLRQFGNLAVKFNAMDGSDLISCVQITDEAATKEAALAEVCRELGVSTENVLAMGDGPGDAGFLSMAGVAGVMGNGDIELFGIPNRVILPSVQNDGAAIGIERHVFNEPGELRISRPKVWRDGQRPPMSSEARDKVLTALLQGDSLVQDPEKLNAHVASLYSFMPLNPWDSAGQLKACLTPEAQELYTTDLDLLRPCKGEDHANAVRNLFEEHFSDFLRHSPAALASMRLYLELQDSAKSLSVAITGDSFSQGKYNPLVNDNILRSLNGRDALHMQQAISLLSRYDLVGELLKAKPEELDEVRDKLKNGPLAEIRALWPRDIGASADDMLLIAYLCDAGAHTRFAAQADELSVDFDLKWAVTPEDAQLTQLFEQGNDGRLLLQPEQRRRVASLLNEVTAAADVLELYDNEDNSLDSHAADCKVTIQYLFDRLRLENSDKLIEEDIGTSTSLEVVYTPTKWEWVKKLVFKEAQKASLLKPQKVPGGHVVLEGHVNEELWQHTYYVRGGKIWRQEQKTAYLGDTIKDRLRLLDTLHNRDEIHRYEGSEAAAEADVRMHFGVPLSDGEAEEFMTFLQSNL